MAENSVQTAPTGVKLWWMAIRPFAFPASVIPVLYGAVLAVVMHPEIKFNYVLLVLTMIGTMLTHVGTNLINDIYDYKKGLDKEDLKQGVPHGGSQVLSRGMMSSSQLKIGAFVSLALAVVIGIIIYMNVGPDNRYILYLVIFGLVSSILYTATPFALKYNALGDIQVIASMGAAITLGSYLVQVLPNGLGFSWMPVLYSLPIGLLIDAILHANNIRDKEVELRFGVKTLPTLMSDSASKMFYYFLIFGAYVSVVLFVLFTGLHPLALLSFITLPIALKLVKMLNDNETIAPEARFDYGSRHTGMTAQFNVQFGLSLIIGLLIAYFISM